LANEIKDMLNNHLDQVIEILRECTGIGFGKKLVTSMLEEYWAEEGHFYVGATLENIPWIFAYMSNNQKLYGQYIVENSPMAEAIAKYCPSALLVSPEKADSNQNQSNNQKNMVQISAKPGNFLDLTFAFLEHRKLERKSKVTGKKRTIELMQLVVWNKRDNIFETEIVFDTDLWFNIANPQPSHP